MSPILRAPSAWLPIAVSLVALVTVVAWVAVVGVVERPDEGAPARLFQVVMLGVAAAIVVFALRWLPRAPRVAALVLALQLLCATLPVLAILIAES